MNLLYVGDNRNRLNWGCIATSIALKQLLDKEFNVSQVIYGDYVAFSSKAGLGYNNYYDKIYRKVKKSFFSKKIGFQRRFKYDNDYLTVNPQHNLQEFLKYRGKNRNVDFIYNAVLDSDTIVINAEGSFIFSNPPRRDTLFFLLLAELANFFGKKIYFVNGMIAECPKSGHNESLLEYTTQKFLEASFVSIRDKESYRSLKLANSDVSCKYIPDALFSWFQYFHDSQYSKIISSDFLVPFSMQESCLSKISLSKPYICIGGSSSSAWDQKRAILSYTELVNTLKNIGINIVLVQSCVGDRFLQKVALDTNISIVPVETHILLATKVLANAQLFISGRYHPSIMASLGGTPSLFLGSNSHKTRSLQETLEYENVVEFSDYPSSQECQKILGMAKEILEDGELRRNKIINVVNKLAIEAETVVDFIK